MIARLLTRLRDRTATPPARAAQTHHPHRPGRNIR